MSSFCEIQVDLFAEDIMYEVFRAMKSLDMEWKVLNPYHVIARKKPDNPMSDPVSLLSFMHCH